MALKEFDDPHLLRQVQLALKKVLEEFDRICRELEIPYVVYGGTAIGAVRHQGFVPWDDDVDVLMTRADYERFLVEAPARLGDEYRIDNTRNRDDFPYMFTKLVLKGTLLIPEFAKESRYRMPVFLDILPVDNIPDDPRKFGAQSRRSWFWGRLLFLQGTPKPFLTIDGPLRVAIHAATTVIHWGIRLLGITPRSIQARWERAVRKYEDQETRQMADFTMRDPQNWTVTRDELFPAVDVPFEDITVKLPRAYDAMLRRGYGDYMQLPPVEKRTNHRPHLVDLGPYGELGTTDPRTPEGAR